MPSCYGTAFSRFSDRGNELSKALSSLKLSGANIGSYLPRRLGCCVVSVEAVPLLQSRAGQLAGPLPAGTLCCRRRFSVSEGHRMGLANYRIFWRAGSLACRS